jgi:G3E family GTPase
LGPAFTSAKLPEILNTRRFDFQHAAAPGWLPETRGEHVPETEEYGIGSFVYRARKPFHPQRLVTILSEDQLGGVIRSKGFIWLATRHNVVNTWSQAGAIVNVEIAGTWWIQRPREHWPDEPAFRASVASLLQDQVYGDRRQELVCIGKEMNQAQLRELLDAALLTDEEMAQGPEQWRTFPDPFPSIAELEEDAIRPVHAHAEHEESGKHHHHVH